MSLALVDSLTTRVCSTDARNSCLGPHAKAACEEIGRGHCDIVTDGYFVQVMLCTVFGIAWLLLCYRRVMDLQRMPVSAWRVVSA